MGVIIGKTNRIGMVIYFESEVVHLYYCLPEVIPTYKISSVETDFEENAKNIELQIATLRLKINTSGGSESGYIPMAQCKKRAKKYWKMGE